MKSKSIVAACLFALGLSLVAHAADKPTFASVLDNQLKGVEGEFVPAAEAMPADKFSFAPTQGEFKGVRSFGTQVKHVAAVNYIIGSAILGSKPPVDIGQGEDGPASVQSSTTMARWSSTSARIASSRLPAANSVPHECPTPPSLAGWGLFLLGYNHSQAARTHHAYSRRISQPLNLRRNVRWRRGWLVCVAA
jgi:hypothetical protein